VTLTAGGETQSQPLVVRKDPNSRGSEADIAAQTRVASSIHADLVAAADAVHRLESARVQLDTLARTATETGVRNAAAALHRRLTDLEMELVDLRLTGRGQDGVRFGSKLIGKLGYLANGIGSSDDRPTDQHLEVQQLLNGQLRTHLAALDRLLAEDLAALNTRLRQRNLREVVVTPAGRLRM
jgi:hypothetical protein